MSSAASSGPIRILELRSVRGTGGGPEKTILYGAQHSERAGFQVTVCYLRDPRDEQFRIAEWAKRLGVEYREVHERHSFDPAIYSQMKALATAFRPHIVHCHEYKTNILGYFLARRVGAAPLSTVHGWFGRETSREKLYYGLDRLVLRRFAHIIAVSSPLRRQLLRAGCRGDRVTCILNAIDETAFAPDPSQRADARRRLGLSDTDFVIGGIGRLERQKRFDLLLRAVAALKGRQPRVRLLIAGAGTLDSELARLATDLQVNDMVRFLGHHSDVIGLHRALDLFVQSSDGEGLPNVVLEAMALGTPVVATRVGGTEDLIVDGTDGRLIEAGDLDRMVRAIEAMMADPEATRVLALAARGRVEREFAFSRRMELVEEIYRQLALNGPAAKR